MPQQNGALVPQREFPLRREVQTFHRSLQFIANTSAEAERRNDNNNCELHPNRGKACPCRMYVGETPLETMQWPPVACQ